MQETRSPRSSSVLGRGPPGRFVSGSLLRHVLVMTGTGAVGLMAIFIGDIANILFLSLLEDVEVVAAVGYASSVMFFATSIGIGLAIATAAVVSPAVGAGDLDRARRLAASTHLFAAIVSAVLALALMPLVPALMTLLGATGRTHRLATEYLWIITPTLPPLAVAMASSAVLRSVGDARRSMHVTLAAAVVNTALDPVFIFLLGMGIHGAAIASAIARVVIVAVGLHGVARVHRMIAAPRLVALQEDAPIIARVAFPAVLTNVASPVANAYVTAAFAPYGDSAVAGWAVIGRIMPVAFAAMFALSGSIGPIVGQNYGVGDGERMRKAVTISALVTAGYTVWAWVLLAILAYPLVRLFQASGEAAQLIVLFCRWLAPLFGVLGLLFVANAVFNTLGRAHWATAINWARATLGTIPFVYAGGLLAGAPGVLAGNMVGGVLFSVVALWLCYRLIDRVRPSA